MADSSRRRHQRGTETRGWRERLAALRYVGPLIRLVWETHHGYTVTMGVLRILRSFVPIATLWIGKLIIDTVLAARDHRLELGALWKLVAIEIGVVVLGEILARTSALVESLLGDLFSNHTSVRLMEHAATLDLFHFEDPDFYDKLERARRQTVGRIGLLTQLLSAAQDTITLVSLAAALLVYNPWLLLLLAFAVIPSFVGETHFASLSYSLIYQWTPERRQLDYFRFIGASSATAKEVQLFGLAPWLIRRYRELADKFYNANKKLAIRKAIVATALSFIGTLGYYVAYVVILIDTVAGRLTLGSLTFLAASFARGRDIFQRLFLGASDIFEQSLYLKDLFDFFAMEPSIRSMPNARPVPQVLTIGFAFEDVGFRYPESERWAIRNVSFALRPGERLAFVGENGAGKTTLAKLITRLYDPTEGRILLEGVDLREYDVASLRRAISVIFQDFVRYDFRFDENIGVGEIESVGEYFEPEATGLREQVPEGSTVPPPPDRIVDAAEKSLASTLLGRFSSGYRQMLGRRFEGGVDLSGGEWQKIALARAYMRDAHLLILDEPTAALDARAEYEVFVRFSELVAGRMAIIISHRFSTVRMADRIIVLRNGRLVESWTHDELIATGGLNAEMFELQPEGYR
jgi:ATP-binding cassette subfamily B protein